MMTTMCHNQRDWAKLYLTPIQSLLRVLYTATHMHYYGMQLRPHYLIKTVVLL